MSRIYTGFYMESWILALAPSLTRQLSHTSLNSLQKEPQNIIAASLLHRHHPSHHCLIALHHRKASIMPIPSTSFQDTARAFTEAFAQFGGHNQDQEEEQQEEEEEKDQDEEQEPEHADPPPLCIS